MTNLYTLSSASFASWDGNPDRRRAFAIKQDVTGGSSDGSQLGIAGSEASEVLVGLHELKALVPVHVCQGSSRSPAHACMSYCTILRQLLRQTECFVLALCCPAQYHLSSVRNTQ